MKKNRQAIHPLLFKTLLFLGFAIAFTTNAIAYNEKNTKKAECEAPSQFTFSWALSDNCDFKPRGGSSKGVKNILDKKVHPGWLSLQEKGLSSFEKDRRAILAMAGPYRVSFDFLETVGYVPGFTPEKPYQSWGTEYIYVAQDTGKYISLQHIMVMLFKSEDGTISAPMVMKHWRQDWEYQKNTNFVYVGHQQWDKKKFKRQDVKGTWSQAVYHVDDSPRYESLGKWQHNTNFSSWISGQTSRPLPRRESSVRNDYHILSGTNRHTILPNGWVQEEENLKLVLAPNGNIAAELPYLAKELGMARYERIVEHDFTSGDEYWKKSSAFWADVRLVWKDLIAKNDSLTVKRMVNKTPMFMPFFSKAQAIVDGEQYDSASGRERIKLMLKPFIEAN